MASGRATDFMIRVQSPRKPFILKPAMMHLISEMPEPAAYGANDLTKVAAVNANTVYER